jgi:glucosylceramidase
MSTGRTSLVAFAAVLVGGCGSLWDTGMPNLGSTDSGLSDGGSGEDAGPSVTLMTSAENAYWQTGTVTAVTSGTADMTVDDTTTYQRWDGFGGAFNEMGWDNLSLLSASDRTKALTLLFDPNNGAGFVYGRIPIGASDFAISRYTDDETPNDYQMTSFSISRDMQYLIPYVKAAMAINPKIHFWASPWTPPAWMKDNNNTDSGNMQDNAQILQAYALYLTKWVQAYDAQGITIEVIHPQNEPNYAEGYPSCVWAAPLYDKFVSMYLGPMFESQNMSTQIYLGTMSNAGMAADPAIVTAVTGDSATMKYIKGFGLQWSMQFEVAQLSAQNLPIVQTEHQAGNYPWDPSTFNPNQAPNDYPYAVESWGLIRDWIKTGVNSYGAWNMVLDTIGKSIDTTRIWPQDALMTVDRTAKTLNVTPAFYVFRHFSQYVQPGATRVGTTGTTLDALAFKNPDGSIVAIMYNMGPSPVMTTLGVGGEKLQFSVPGNGFATVKK